MILNIIVLLFELLYYSMFMKFARNEGKFWKYLLLFSLITVIGVFIGTDNLYSYIVLILLILFGLKYIVGIKQSLYDMLFVDIMFLYKIILEMIFSYPIYFVINNIYISTIIVCFIKMLSIILLRKKLNKLYNKLHDVWNKNNFYIRYLFAMLNIAYVILSCVYLIIEII